MLSVEPPLPSFLRSSNVCAAAPALSSARPHTADAKAFMGSLHSSGVSGPTGDRLTRPVAGEDKALAPPVEGLDQHDLMDRPAHSRSALPTEHSASNAPQGFAGKNG